MSLLAATAAALLLVSGPGPGGNSTGDAARLAATGGFLLGNAHRCGVGTDRVVRTGQLIRELIAAAAQDEDDRQTATERFAKFFMATAVPDKGEGKLVASCELVTSEFQKLEAHRVVTAGAKPEQETKKAAGSTTLPKFRLGDGE
jgi:hypothetical protein